jgi:hypothetical protein
MNLECKDKRLKTSISLYLQEIVCDLPDALGETVETPAGNSLFDEDNDSIRLDVWQKKIIHHIVTKTLSHSHNKISYQLCNASCVM